MQIGPGVRRKHYHAPYGRDRVLCRWPKGSFRLLRKPAPQGKMQGEKNTKLPPGVRPAPGLRSPLGNNVRWTIGAWNSKSNHWDGSDNQADSGAQKGTSPTFPVHAPERSSVGPCPLMSKAFLGMWRAWGGEAECWEPFSGLG